MSRSEGRTNGAPAPVAEYSQAIRVGNIVSVAGQIGLDPATGSIVPGGVGPETTRALKNAEAALESCGASMDDVVRVDVILASIDDFQTMNLAYSGAFAPPYPTRTTTAAALAGPAGVEITVLAVAENGKPE